MMIQGYNDTVCDYDSDLITMIYDSDYDGSRLKWLKTLYDKH